MQKKNVSLCRLEKKSYLCAAIEKFIINNLINE